jgi:hypothetical protein
VTDKDLIKEAEELANTMTTEVKGAMKRVMDATAPESYEGLVANVVAMKFLGECAYETLDPAGKKLADILLACQSAVLGPKLRAMLADKDG